MTGGLSSRIEKWSGFVDGKSIEIHLSKTEKNLRKKDLDLTEDRQEKREFPVNEDGFRRPYFDMLTGDKASLTMTAIPGVSVIHALLP